MNSWSDYTANESSRRLRQPPGGGGGAPGGDDSSGGLDALGTCSGMAVTGMPIYNALSGQEVDAVTSEVETMDFCL